VKGTNVILSTATRDLAFNETTYIVITSADYPDGEIRGQLLHIRTPCIPHTRDSPHTCADTLAYYRSTRV